jgi:tripartite-type tricarboxylate transporter receptor subunit TctC
MGKIAALAAALLVGGMATGSARAEDVKEFYSNNTLTLITAGGAAGPYNILARTIEPYLKKYLPGNPNIIVQAMAGAGGLTAANYLYTKAPKDGSVIGITLPTLALNQVFKVEGVAYDVKDFNFLLSVQQEPIVVGVSAKSGFSDWKQVVDKKAVLGSTGLTSNTSIVPKLMNKFLGTQFSVVTGYQGAGNIELAVERGEVDGMAANWSGLKSSQPGWLKNGSFKVIAQSGLTAEADLPNVPTLIDIAPQDKRPVFEFYGLSNALGRVFVAPPGVPADRVTALREALLAVTKDPEFIKLAAERDIDPHAVEHADLEKLAANTVNYDPVVVKIVREAIGAE